MNNILGKDIKAFYREIKNEFILCVLVFFTTIFVNAIVVALRTDDNHYFMLIVNIVIDIAMGIFVLFKFTACVIPKYRKYKLCTKKSYRVIGKINSIATETIRYMNFDCYEVKIDNRSLFLLVDTLKVEIGLEYEMSVVSNIIIEVKQ